MSNNKISNCKINSIIIKIPLTLRVIMINKITYQVKFNIKNRSKDCNNKILNLKKI